MDVPIKKAADLICNANMIVAFTGAGASTESGFPDFWSPGGIWEKYQPVYYGETDVPYCRECRGPQIVAQVKKQLEG